MTDRPDPTTVDLSVAAQVCVRAPVITALYGDLNQRSGGDPHG